MVCLYSLDIKIRPFNGFMCVYVFKQKCFLFEILFETRSHYQKVKEIHQVFNKYYDEITQLPDT